MKSTKEELVDVILNLTNSTKEQAETAAEVIMVGEGVCPECNQEVCLERQQDYFGEKNVAVCTGLVEISEDKPLEACSYSKEIVPGFSGRGIFKKV